MEFALFVMPICPPLLRNVYLENVFKIYKYELTILISFFFKEIGKERKLAQDALHESRNLSESSLSTPT